MGSINYVSLFIGSITFIIYLAKIISPIIQNTDFYRVEVVTILLIRN